MRGSAGDALPGIDYKHRVTAREVVVESGGALVKRKGARPLTSSAAMPANAQDYTERLAEVTESKGDTEASFEWHRAW